MQLDNETYPRQAQILNIQPPDRVKTFTPTEISANYIGEYQIGIERTPFWEDPYPYPTTTAKTSINSIGGTAVLSETINGDVPARIALLNFNSTATIYNNFWLGWRTSRFGTTANFAPVWSLDKGAGGNAGGTDTGIVSDNSAYDGKKMTCTFASSTALIQRTWIAVTDVTANPNDQRGTFTVLLRAKMSDTSTARVRMRAGWFNPQDNTIYNPIYRSRVVINGNNGMITAPWTFYEIGTINIPPLRYFNPNVVLDYFAIALDAERTSGAGNLEMDCLVLIPNDEGMISLKSDAEITLIDTLTLTTTTPPNDQPYGYMTVVLGAITSHNTLTVSAINWGLPANGEAPRLIAAGSGLDSLSTKATTFNLSYTYIPRWRTLRGSVT